MNDLLEISEHFPSVKPWWDFFKNSIKAEIISFARTKRKNLSHDRVVLTNEIIRLKRLPAAGDFSVSSEICELENRLKELVSKELTGVLSVLKLDGLRRERDLLASSSGSSMSGFSVI